MGFFSNHTEAIFPLKKGLQYQFLPDSLKPGFEILGNGLLNFQRNIRITSVKEKRDLERIFDAVIFDNPAICYFNPNEFSISSFAGGYSISFDYIYDRKKASEIIKRMDDQAEYIISQFIMDDMSDFEKCVSIHDYMTENVHYNFSAMSVDYVYDAFTAEGALIKKQAVCIGISKAMVLILGKIHIPCTIVQGMSTIDGQEVAHGWNLVRLSGNFYHIDVTWDLQEVNHFSSRSHMYMNLDDESMLNNHSWEIEAYPTCNSNAENYYVKEKRYFRTFRSFELYCQRFLKAHLTYMDVRFEDTLEIPDDGGKTIAVIIQKQAGLIGKACRIEFLFNACSFVFQAELHYND